MRLFVAIDVDEEIRRRMARYQEGVRGFAPEARWVSPGSFHVTLKFIGESAQYDSIRLVLSTIRAAPVKLGFSGSGFFPNPKAPRVFWIGIQAGENLAALARSVDSALTPLGIAPEARAYTPHITLARSGSGNPARLAQDRRNRVFQSLEERIAALPAPEFGTMTARAFHLYQSRAAPGGAVYTQLEHFALAA